MFGDLNDQDDSLDFVSPFSLECENIIAPKLRLRGRGGGLNCFVTSWRPVVGCQICQISTDLWARNCSCPFVPRLEAVRMWFCGKGWRGWWLVGLEGFEGIWREPGASGSSGRFRVTGGGRRRKRGEGVVWSWVLRRWEQSATVLGESLLAIRRLWPVGCNGLLMNWADLAYSLTKSSHKNLEHRGKTINMVGGSHMTILIWIICQQCW